MEELVKKCGFESLNEFNYLIASLNLSDNDNIEKFKDWQENDGTKDGLLNLNIINEELENE